MVFSLFLPQVLLSFFFFLNVLSCKGARKGVRWRGRVGLWVLHNSPLLSVSVPLLKKISAGVNSAIGIYIKINYM